MTLNDSSHKQKFNFLNKRSRHGLEEARNELEGKFVIKRSFSRGQFSHLFRTEECVCTQPLLRAAFDSDAIAFHVWKSADKPRRK